VKTAPHNSFKALYAQIPEKVPLMTAATNDSIGQQLKPSYKSPQMSRTGN